MKKLLSLFLLLSSFVSTYCQDSSSVDIYLLTCAPGTESYSIYGHSALRVVDQQKGSDLVYNWGVFDFSTPNFNYKFARGRLDYMLGIYTYNRFLQEYFYEQRSVWSQKINFDTTSKQILLSLLNENAKPENIYYRYDFFMDNCATRIRDLIEEAAGEKLVYPDNSDIKYPTYRERLQEFQYGYTWLDMGIDLLIGSPGDTVCGFRGSMFLPLYLKDNMAEATLRNENKSVPLLEPVASVLDYDPPNLKLRFYSESWFLMALLFIAVFIFTFRVRNRFAQTAFDVVFFISMSVLAFLMVFTNYLTDHAAMGENFNMVWLNPLMPIALYAIFLKEPLKWFWRTQIVLTISFMILILFIRQTVNPAYIPVMLILMSRAYYRLNLPSRVSL